MAVASVGPYASLHHAPDRLTTPAPHCSVFTGRMPFPPPNQQCQCTEGKKASSQEISKKGRIAPTLVTSTASTYTWFLRPTRVHDLIGISICRAVLAQLTLMFNRLTNKDHATSVARGRIFAVCLCDAA